MEERLTLTEKRVSSMISVQRGLDATAQFPITDVRNGNIDVASDEEEADEDPSEDAEGVAEDKL